MERCLDFGLEFGSEEEDVVVGKSTRGLSGD